MSASRVAAYVRVGSLPAARRFYGDVLGLAVGFDGGQRCIVFDAPLPGGAQVIALTQEIVTGDLIPQVLVEVDDVDGALRRAQEAGLEVVYPLTDENWGVRRFFVRGPAGELVNVLARTRGESARRRPTLLPGRRCGGRR